MNSNAASKMAARVRSDFVILDVGSGEARSRDDGDLFSDIESDITDIASGFYVGNYLDPCLTVLHVLRPRKSRPLSRPALNPGSGGVISICDSPLRGEKFNYDCQKGKSERESKTEQTQKACRKQILFQ